MSTRHNFGMPRKTPFILVDVFTSRPFGGNQLAVFTDGAALSTSEMQELAHEMNFSESTFVMPPESTGARRVRIFTPKHEMPMAGHPTVGTTWVLASRGDIALESASVDATLQLGIGPVTVTVESTGGKPDFVWMAHREPEFGAKRDDRKRIAEALGITAADIRDDLPIQTVSTGVPFMFVPFALSTRSRNALPMHRRSPRCSNQASLSFLYICSSRMSRASSRRDRGCSRRMTESPRIRRREALRLRSARTPRRIN